jgi:hypothetical protein
MRNDQQKFWKVLLEPRTLQRGYFVANGIQRLMDDHIVRGKTMTGRIWRLLMFELWHRNFLERFTRPAGLSTLSVSADSRRKAPNSAPVLASAPVGE